MVGNCSLTSATASEDVSVTAPNPLDLCRTLLAYTAPGSAVAVPHAALAALVELASGTAVEADSGDVGLPTLYDVATLARRYGRAPATVRQWFADGLFGPAEERRFRGRGYVASAEAVAAFEARTGLRGVGGSPLPPSASEPAPRAIAERAGPITRSGIGGKILAAAQRSTGTRLQPRRGRPR
jgi:hypothetical protein